MKRPDYSAGPVGLMAAILDGLPNLAGAACSGRSDLFDPAGPDEQPHELAYRHRAAARLCNRCPVLDACTGRHPEMVTAARMPAPPGRTGRPRKDTAA